MEERGGRCREEERERREESCYCGFVHYVPDTVLRT